MNSTNGAVDTLRADRNRVSWSRIWPDLPAGLHTPKLAGDVGWDLEAAETVEIKPGHAVDVAINARLHLPSGVWAEIRARSSIARRGLQVDAGTIDTGYRGPLYALVRNMAPVAMDTPWGLKPNVKPIVIEAGERVAQLVFYRTCPVWAIEAEEITLDSERAEAGFGSTGR